jgi:signal transduction histidine kinase
MSKPLELLQVEDSESDASLIVRLLEKAGYTVKAERVQTAAQLRAALEKQPWDVIVADYYLPRFDAPAALSVLRGAALDIPFIVVSGAMGEDRAVAMMKAGAQDYVMKSNLARLAPAVEREIGDALARRELRRAEAERKRIEEQLLQAQKLESIGRLAGGVAHDFNNLLTVINGYGDMLLKELRADDPVYDIVTEIRTAGERAAALTRQLLVLSRKKITQPQPANLNDIVTEVEKMLGRLIGEDICLKSILGASLGRVLADPGLLHQVLMNLAVNARDAMPGGGTLSIETANVDVDCSYVEQHPEMKPGPYVRLQVADTGIGMTKEVQSHLFEPFFTTKKLGEGTGLGLATVYGIVKQSDGSVWVYSEPGLGTTFSIYLPRIDAGADLPPELQPSHASLRGSETILVVEDQDQLRKMAVRVLRDYGYEVIESANPDDALLNSQRYAGPIHLMLTDVIMPGMTGPELVGRIKPLRPTMEIIFMSGYSQHTALDLAGGFLPKPFSPEALAIKVREALGAPRSAVVKPDR